jgi:putative flavoprotein involved in K+ transport
MSNEKVETLVIGAGQAGLAMSEHLAMRGLPHLVLERARLAEAWRTARWDSLVANGPAWHDRFPNLTFDDLEPESFASKDRIVEYFETYARQIAAPIRSGVQATALRPDADGGFEIEIGDGRIHARNVVLATGPFQRPVIPPIIPAGEPFVQIHSNGYRNPDQLPEGAVLVVGAGSSGVQIADELLRSGRKVFLSVGPHNRPPRRYRGKDFCWWLGALGLWDAKAATPGTEHVTIAVSGARGGHTVDFRELASRGMVLLGRAEQYAAGRLRLAGDLAENIARGDEDYLAVLRAADALVERDGLDLPEEPDAHVIAPASRWMLDPLMEVDLAAEGVAAVVWATGYTQDYSWIQAPAFDDLGRPQHDRGVSPVPGLYFLGLPWLSRRASPFIWGVWHDADYLAEHIAGRMALAGGSQAGGAAE